MTSWTRADEAAAGEVLGRPLSRGERARFTEYLGLLTRWQRAQRLVGSVEPRWVFKNLFVDSLLFLKVLPAAACDVLDLGSGAGVPGIPLKIVKPDLRLTLLEGHRKRVSFLRAVVRELGLDAVDVVNARAEVWIPEHRCAFDAVLMRCAGPAEEMLRLGEQALRADGVAITSGPPAAASVPYGEAVVVRATACGRERRFVVVHARARRDDSVSLGDPTSGMVPGTKDAPQ